jgi:hypothetical protein
MSGGLSHCKVQGFIVTLVIVIICDYTVCCNAEGFYCGSVYKEEEL